MDSFRRCHRWFPKLIGSSSGRNKGENFPSTAYSTYGWRQPRLDPKVSLRRMWRPVSAFGTAKPRRAIIWFQIVGGKNMAHRIRTSRNTMTGVQIRSAPE